MKIFKPAFTLAEILISLTILGIVTAMVVPSLQDHINQKSWTAKRKALYSRISQAISLMDYIGDFGIGLNDNETRTNAAQAFIINGLRKNLKLNNICDKNKITKCGLPAQIVNSEGSKVNFPSTMYALNSLFSRTDTINNVAYSTGVLNTDAAAFETINGDSVAVFYNPNCGAEVGVQDSWNYTQPYMCANFIYDLNGKKGPNVVGKDIGFITALYPTKSMIVAPLLSNYSANGVFNANLFENCNVQKNNTVAPSKEELFSLFYNISFIKLSSGSGTVSCLYSYGSSTETAEKAFNLDLATGKWQKVNSSTSCLLPCIKK